MLTQPYYEINDMIEMNNLRRPSGKNHGNWKGGKILSGGYYKIYAPFHPHATGKYVMEHRLIWEQIHGMFLPNDWIVHHINGNKTDNRPENLMAMPSSAHLSNHQNEFATEETMRKWELELLATKSEGFMISKSELYIRPQYTAVEPRTKPNFPAKILLAPLPGRVY